MISEGLETNSRHVDHSTLAGNVRNENSSECLLLFVLPDFKVCFISLHSLGVALSRGHGKYFFRGNVTVEEGKIPTSSCCLHSSFIVDLVDLKLVCLSADSIRELDIFFFFFFL